MITLRDFIVHKKLTIGNIKVEAKKVSAEYCIHRFDAKILSYEFSYVYENNHFDPESYSDVNLACMMLAQVALNYGLFFEEIEFDGLFDAADERFIREMTENTSVEILINKLLTENPFLHSSYKKLEFVKQEIYTAASIRFMNSRFGYLTMTKKSCSTNKDAFAILSSGGKESLLSYGLLNELGEAYPIFVNESGRHWFTAYNAFHFLKIHDSRTAKPWTNSDRVFNWFLKNLPFIKENYNDIRADIYPLRLWTVAIFVFAVLPVARSNNIGNIIIGNEYDTTVRGVYKGITHYKGLYDQSRYFDKYLSKYYQQKGWNISQYSLLRNLSEMLGLKILVNRYPDFHKLQVSCHAAHSEDGRMYPCGKCEKCHRIIGMLLAMKATPERCGYNSTQISKGLTSLAVHGTHQIESDRAHLYHLMLNKGIIESNVFTKKLAKPHPEIFKLRFWDDKNRLSEIPSHLRLPLLNILSKYSDGAVRMVDGKWQEISTEELLNNCNNYSDGKN
ncbi:hypothetical protein ACFLT1_02020 [Bacteroidota bacterium]